MSEYKYLDKDGLIYYHSKIKTLLSGKVDKENGKGLSTNDYTTTEKNKLNGIASGAEVNQNAFSNIKIGNTTVAADSKTDTLELVAGSNVTLTPDTTNGKVTISSTDTTYSNATTSSSGLMSASDKTNLDAINGYVEGSYRIASMHHPDVVVEWESEGAYSNGSWVIHNNHIYTCIADEATEGSFISNEWQEYDLLNWCLGLTRNQTDLFRNDNELYGLTGNIPLYSTSTNYKIGDLVYWYDDNDLGSVFKCIENTSGTWDSTKWQKTGAFSEIKLLEDAGYITSADYATTTTAGVIKLGNNAIMNNNGVILAGSGSTAGDTIWNRTAPNYFASYSDVYYAISGHIDTSLSSSSDDTHYPSSKCVYDAINDAIGSVTGISYEIVQTLPQTGSIGIIYLLSNSGTSPNVYDEYIWLANSSSFEKIGTTDVDLSGYVQSSEMVTITNAEIDAIVA